MPVRATAMPLCLLFCSRSNTSACTFSHSNNRIETTQMSEAGNETLVLPHHTPAAAHYPACATMLISVEAHENQDLAACSHICVTYSLHGPRNRSKLVLGMPGMALATALLCLFNLEDVSTAEHGCVQAINLCEFKEHRSLRLHKKLHLTTSEPKSLVSVLQADAGHGIGTESSTYMVTSQRLVHAARQTCHEISHCKCQ
jgi:hypothetical protein